MGLCASKPVREAREDKGDLIQPSNAPVEPRGEPNLEEKEEETAPLDNAHLLSRWPALEDVRVRDLAAALDALKARFPTREALDSATRDEIEAAVAHLGDEVKAAFFSAKDAPLGPAPPPPTIPDKDLKGAGLDLTQHTDVKKGVTLPMTAANRLVLEWPRDLRDLPASKPPPAVFIKTSSRARPTGWPRCCTARWRTSACRPSTTASTWTRAASWVAR